MKSCCWALGWMLVVEANEALQAGGGCRVHLMKAGVGQLFDRIGLAHLVWHLAAIGLGRR